MLPLFFFSAISKLRKHVIIWAIVPFILIHCFIGHKEVRFLFVIHYFIIFLTLYGLSAYFHEKKFKKYQLHIFKVAIVINIMVMMYMILKPANGTVLYQKYLYENIAKGNHMIVTTNRDYYKIMGNLQSTFYRPNNIHSYAVPSEYNLAAFLNKNNIDSCFYVHRGLSFSGLIPGYKTEKVYALYPNWITEVPYVDSLHISTDCIYLVTKI